MSFAKCTNTTTFPHSQAFGLFANDIIDGLFHLWSWFLPTFSLELIHPTTTCDDPFQTPLNKVYMMLCLCARAQVGHTFWLFIHWKSSRLALFNDIMHFRARNMQYTYNLSVIFLWDVSEIFLHIWQIYAHLWKVSWILLLHQIMITVTCWYNPI